MRTKNLQNKLVNSVFHWGWRLQATRDVQLASRVMQKILHNNYEVFLLVFLPVVRIGARPVANPAAIHGAEIVLYTGI